MTGVYILLALFVFHWYASLFFQSFFHHRYAAHKMFTMSRGWEKAMHLMSFVFQGSSYLSPYAYGVMHRLHHAYADTEKDPHSPKYDLNLFNMMWRTRRVYLDIDRGIANIDAKFLKDVPQWRSFDKFAESRWVRLAWVVIYVLIYALFAEVWWVWLLLPLNIIMGPLHGVVINWFAHKYGYTNFEVGDTSKNLLPFDFLMWGESYHNNHHKYGSRANFGVKWHEFDPMYPLIKLMHKLKIIRLVNTQLPA